MLELFMGAAIMNGVINEMDAMVSIRAVVDKLGGLAQLEWLITGLAKFKFATAGRLTSTGAPHQEGAVGGKGNPVLYVLPPIGLVHVALGW